jgi:hypothetical protein
MIGIDTSPILKINRVIVTGELGCDIKLGSGLNIIKADPYEGDASASNDCGKTTFTDLIKYGLGDRDRFDTGELSSKISELFLEIKINDEIFTIQRSLTSPYARLSIFQSAFESNMEYHLPALKIDPQTPYSDYLLERIGIPRIRIPRSTKPGSQPIPISLQDFLRVLYMDQKNSFQEIMNKVQPEWLKTKIVQILLGMAKEEVEQTTSKIQELSNQIDELDREIKNITNFLKNSGNTNRTGVREKKNEVLQNRQNLNVQIDELKRQMRGERGITDELRENLEQVNYRLSELQDSKAKILFKTQDFKNLLNSLLVDRDKVHKTQEANYTLSSIEFVQCPRCLQRITAEMKRYEEDGACMLCARPLLVEERDTKIVDKDEIVNEEIREVEILLGKYQGDLEPLNTEINHLLLSRVELQQELDRQTKTYVSPFVDRLELLLNQRNQLDAEIELLDQQIYQWELLEGREDWLNQLKADRLKLQALIASIDTSDHTKIRYLSDSYEGFLRRIGYQNLREAHIDDKDLMPRVNGNVYTADTGLGMVGVKVIAYHYSLLEFSLQIPCYYPRFLMVDSPRAADLNPDTYRSLLLQFHRLQSKFMEQDFQLICTTRDLPEEMEEYVIENLNNRNRMLLRPEGQREQSSTPT